MTEELFWSLLEQAWEDVSPKLKSKRMKIAAKKGFKEPTELGAELAEVVAGDLVNNLLEKLKNLSREDLLEFDRILERKLYEIDRADIQEYTDGSEDGFMYCRGFIVGQGKEYYEMIKNEPQRAMADLEAESFCYCAVYLYEDLYGEMPQSDISRETGGNQSGWK